MKQLKLLILAIITTLITGTNGFAFFDDGHLTAVFYNSSGTVAIDLGAINSMHHNKYQVLKNTGSIYDGTIFSPDSFNELNIAVYGVGPETERTEWFATTADFAPNINLASRPAFKQATTVLSTMFAESGTDTYTSSIGTSFDGAMHAGSKAEGSFAGYNYFSSLGIRKPDSESLESLDLYLYKFTNIGLKDGILEEGSHGEYQSVIRLYKDGSIILNPDIEPEVIIVTTPLPTAALLFGTGFLPLLGYRRRNTA